MKSDAVIMEIIDVIQEVFIGLTVKVIRNYLRVIQILWVVKRLLTLIFVIILIKVI